LEFHRINTRRHSIVNEFFRELYIPLMIEAYLRDDVRRMAVAYEAFPDA